MKISKEELNKIMCSEAAHMSQGLSATGIVLQTIFPYQGKFWLLKVDQHHYDVANETGEYEIIEVVQQQTTSTNWAVKQ